MGKVSNLTNNIFRIGWNHQLVYSWGIYESNPLFLQAFGNKHWSSEGMLEEVCLNNPTIILSTFLLSLNHFWKLYCKIRHYFIAVQTSINVIQKLWTNYFHVSPHAAKNMYCISTWFHAQLGVWKPQLGIPIVTDSPSRFLRSIPPGTRGSQQQEWRHRKPRWFQIFFIFIPILGEMMKFDSYFSNGLKPPTSKLIEDLEIVPYKLSSSLGFQTTWCSEVWLDPQKNIPSKHQTSRGAWKTRASLSPAFFCKKSHDYIP